jgi:hypothetical protein
VKDKALALDLTKKAAIVLELKNLPAVNPYGKTFQALQDTVESALQGKGALSSGLDLRPSMAGKPGALLRSWNANWRSP